MTELEKRNHQIDTIRSLFNSLDKRLCETSSSMSQAIAISIYAEQIADVVCETSHYNLYQPSVIDAMNREAPELSKFWEE
jgi:hypothetical protein